MAKLLLQRFSKTFFNVHQVFPVLAVRYPFCSGKFTEGEKNIINALKKNFPSASHIEVVDISGGCGAMYEVFIESEDFRGKNTLAQHRLVNKALASEIKDMHGLRISTQAPSEEN